MKLLFRVILSLGILLLGVQGLQHAWAQQYAATETGDLVAAQYSSSGRDIDVHELSLHIKYAPSSKKENEKIFVTERADFDEDDETSNDDDDRAGLNTQFAATGYHAARDYCCPLKAMATPTPEYFAYTSSFRCALYQVYRI